MQRRAKINTVFKKLFVSFFGLLGVEILTRSDHTTNGLQPIVREFFIRQCRGVLHIGAHEGQEADKYYRMSRSVIWVEAVPLYFQKLTQNIEQFHNQVAFNALLGSQCSNSRDFYITSNNGESSSVYPLAGNEYWRGLENSETVRLPSKRLDCLIPEVQVREYDYWIVDVQGAEIEVLEGAGDLLEYCRYLQVEISQEKFYEGGADFQDLKTFLEAKWFIPMWLPSKPHEEIIFRNLKFKESGYS